MSSERDLDDEMKRFGLDDDTADRLLSGQVAPQDAPPGYQPIAHAVRAAQSWSPVDDGRETATVAAVVEALVSDSQSRTPVRRKPMLARILSAKIAAIGAVTLLGATAAAAATSTLPDTAQAAVSDAASHVGLSVPKPNHHANPRATSHPTKPDAPGNGGAVGPDATGSAKFGLCSAYASGNAATNPNSHKTSSVAFTKLQAAADDAGMTVTDYCKTTTPPSTSPTESDSTDTPKSNNAGRPASTPSGPPAGTPVGPPTSTPVGPPHSVPVGPPTSTPVGPPDSVPVGPPTSTPVGPPHAVPVGPPLSTPGQSHQP